MPFKNYREESKGNWGIQKEQNQSLNKDELQLGAILRIADATEKMAVSYSALAHERDKYKRWHELVSKDNRTLYRRIAALQGVITKLKKVKKNIIVVALLTLSLTGTAQDTIKQAPDGSCYVVRDVAKPDTLRATLIVYYDGNQPSALHTKPGFVVRRAFKDNIYLDDRKKVIKKPIEVLTYKLK